MSQLIDNAEINSLLFDHKRVGFNATASKATKLSFTDSSDNAIVAHFHSTEKNSPNIIFFPSTETPLAHLEAMATSYTQHGINILILSYRGDNGNSQLSTLNEFYLDGRVLFEQASAWLSAKGYDGAQFVMGQSLGSILAIDVVYLNPDSVKGLLLESAMSETTVYLKNRGIETDSISELEERGFCNIEKIEKITLPTLIFHGAQDTWIPIAAAEKLQASSGARTKQFFIIPGAQHNFLYNSGGDLYFETIKKFIDTLCGVNTWRQKRRKYLEEQGK